MVDYVISEEKLRQMIRSDSPVVRGKIAFFILSHSLEEELKKEKNKILEELDVILNRRTELMEELFEELRDPAVAKHSLQQIEIIRYYVNELRGEP